MQNQSINKLEVGVKVFLRRSDGKFLLLKRAKPHYGQNYCQWDIPGGRIIPGETQLEALQREVQEETGLRLEGPLQVLGVQDILHLPGKHVVRISYLATCTDTEAVQTRPKEHSEFRWLPLEELHTLIQDNLINELLEKLKDRLSLD